VNKEPNRYHRHNTGPLSGVWQPLCSLFQFVDSSIDAPQTLTPYRRVHRSLYRVTKEEDYPRQPRRRTRVIQVFFP